MMETKANYVAVGAFVLACMLGLVITILWLAGMQYARNTPITRPISQARSRGSARARPSATTASKWAASTISNSIPTIPKSSSRRFRSSPISESASNSVTSIESQGLTGGSYVEIAGGNKNAPLLTAQEGQRYPVIKSAPSTLQKLAKGVPQLLEKLNIVADKLNETLSPQNQRALSNILANLDRTTGTLARRSGDIDSAIADISKASKALPGTVADTDNSVKKIGQLSTDADTFVKSDGLAQLSALLADTRRLVISLNKLSDQLNQQPTKLLFGDRRKGYTPK